MQFILVTHDVPVAVHKDLKLSENDTEREIDLVLTASLFPWPHRTFPVSPK